MNRKAECRRGTNGVVALRLNFNYPGQCGSVAKFHGFGAESRGRPLSVRRTHTYECVNQRVSLFPFNAVYRDVGRFIRRLARTAVFGEFRLVASTGTNKSNNPRSEARGPEFEKYRMPEGHRISDGGLRRKRVEPDSRVRSCESGDFSTKNRVL